MFLSDAISEDKRVQVALHELGHRNHSPDIYENFREKCEHRSKPQHDSSSHEGRTRYRWRYQNIQLFGIYGKIQPKTIADEVMVKEEYLALVN